jgi:cell division transport system permease protein
VIFLSRLGFVLKEGFAQLFRTRGPSTAIVVIVTSTLLQLSLFLAITKGLDRALASAKRKFELTLFMEPSANASDRKRVQDLLVSDPRVAEVKVITKEEALQEFRSDPEIDRMVQALGENPLTDSLSAVLRTEAAGGLEDLVGRLKGEPGVDEVAYGKDEWETVSRLSRLTRWVGWGLGAFIFMTALFIVSNTLTIALWARREDYLIMARMGAPTWMKWGPYLWEGALQGLLGGILTVLVLETARRAAQAVLHRFGGLDALLGLTGGEGGGLYGTLLLLGVGLGVLGAFLALRQKWVKEMQ